MNSRSNGLSKAPKEKRDFLRKDCPRPPARPSRPDYHHRGCSSSPEIPETLGRKLGVTNRVLDVLMPEIGLQRPRVMTGVRQREAAAMTQHVRMNLERHPRSLADPTEQRVETLGRHRAATLGDEDVRR